MGNNSSAFCTWIEPHGQQVEEGNPKFTTSQVDFSIMRDPWDQMIGEPKAAYRRFLGYKNLGPGRSLSLAYQFHLATVPIAEAKKEAEVLKGIKKCNRHPGSWQEESIKYKWVERSQAWDIDQLQKVGSDIAPMWAGILRAMVMKAAEALAKPGFRPRQWKDAVLVFAQVAPYLNPDVFKALQSAGTALGSPASKTTDSTANTFGDPDLDADPGSAAGCV